MGRLNPEVRGYANLSELLEHLGDIPPERIWLYPQPGTATEQDVILAEAVNPGRSLGYMVQLAYSHQRASWSFAELIVIGGIGLLTDFLIRSLSKLLFRWREAAL